MALNTVIPVGTLILVHENDLYHWPWNTYSALSVYKGCSESQQSIFILTFRFVERLFIIKKFVSTWKTCLTNNFVFFDINISMSYNVIDRYELWIFEYSLHLLYMIMKRSKSVNAVVISIDFGFLRFNKFHILGTKL